MSAFSELESFLFHQGTNYSVYKKMGAHIVSQDGVRGTRFVVWAPNAQDVSVVCVSADEEKEHHMERSYDGIWERFVPHVKSGDTYRYAVTGADGVKRYKSDPYSFRYELRPDNASVVCSLSGYRWNDSEYQSHRHHSEVMKNPMSVYEVHLGSWKKGYRGEDDADGFLNYRELGDQLAEYVTYMGYTHVELMGICEYPFDPSWGYQVTGYFAPTSRYGTPNDFRYLVDRLHQSGIGVILDWVPAHFPKDEFALGRFDGTPLYESADPLRAEFPIWGTYAFDHSKPEVRSFLISSAFYWIEEFHIDALRVDAVAAMQYADFSRTEWRPNIHGGHINLESTDFLKQLNRELTERTTGYLLAEDSSIEQGITNDVHVGGLGFTFKWNMGWMFDTLKYLSYDFLERRYHHGELTHIPDYAFTENFILVLSHDEVNIGKGSILARMPGSFGDRFGGVKALYAFQFTFPGKKLLFMGQDFAQDADWDFGKSLDWHLADEFSHRDVLLTVRRLNFIYRSTPTLYTDSKDSKTFEWVNKNYADANIISYIRKNPFNYDGAVLVVCNFSPWHHHDFASGVPMGGEYTRLFSTYDNLPGAGGPEEIGGSPKLYAENVWCDGRPFRLRYGLRPFEVIIVKLP
ncbi:MAG: 1,4-alpha-glucan branching protein GlgB [Ruminococcus sp.]|nr:1,4-alpha-glucan branching protein GlgB [Ruminococcus sp.]